MIRKAISEEPMVKPVGTGVAVADDGVESVVLEPIGAVADAIADVLAGNPVDDGKPLDCPLKSDANELDKEAESTLSTDETAVGMLGDASAVEMADAEALTASEGNAVAPAKVVGTAGVATGEDTVGATAPGTLLDGCTVTVTNDVVCTVTTWTPVGASLARTELLGRAAVGTLDPMSVVDVITEAGSIDVPKTAAVSDAEDEGTADEAVIVASLAETSSEFTTNLWRVKPETEVAAEGDAVAGIARSTFASMVQSSPSSADVAVAAAAEIEEVIETIVARDEEAGVAEESAVPLLMSMVHSGPSSPVLVGTTGAAEMDAADVAAGVETMSEVAKEAEEEAVEATVLFPKRLASAPACCILAIASSCVSQEMLVPSLATNGKAAQMVPAPHGMGTHALSTHWAKEFCIQACWPSSV